MRFWGNQGATERRARAYVGHIGFEEVLTPEESVSDSLSRWRLSDLRGVNAMFALEMLESVPLRSWSIT